MRKISKVIIINTLLLMALSASASGAEVKKVIAATNGVTPRISFVDNNNNLTGFEVEVLKEVDRRLDDYDIEFITMDSSSFYAALDANKVDVVMGNMRRSEAREKKYLFATEPHNYYPYRLIVAQGNNSINSLEDLKGKKIELAPGAQQTVIVETWNAQNGNEIEIVYSTSGGATSVLDIKSGRVDATVLGEYYVKVYNETSDARIKTVGEEIRFTDGVASDSDAYYVFQKNDAGRAFRDRASAAIREIRADGTLSKISITWFDEDRTLKIDSHRLPPTE
ncbi:MAG: transporter substrate-binding domain-containing protein [Synergistaceae bacterium]|nr:transporter substrate-binding domain-containing protein [Synergistaceae bacterium]